MTISVVPPQFTAASQQRPYQVLAYLSSVTGTPVASYLRTLSFSALLTEGIQNGCPLCLAPTGNSLQVLSESTCFCSPHFICSSIPIGFDEHILAL